jgi:biopolymer transport protein ExbD
MKPTSEPPRAYIDVTPMLDVLLVIMVVFLLVQMLRVWPTLYAQTPPPCTGTCTDAVPVVLEVGPADRLAINGEAVPLSSLGERLSELVTGRGARTLMVKGDRRVTYQQVVSAMDVARGAGFLGIGVMP